MTALVVMLTAVGTWTVLMAIKRAHVERDRRRAASSWLGGHQRTVRGNQIGSEVEASRRIGYRR